MFSFLSAHSAIVWDLFIVSGWLFNLSVWKFADMRPSDPHYRELLELFLIIPWTGIFLLALKLLIYMLARLFKNVGFL